MEKGISISEIVETIREDGHEAEVCATAEATYNAAEQEVSVALDCFARHITASGNGTHLPRPWLPSPEHVREHLSRSEATTFAKDVFRSWVKKVRAAIPHGT
jgi:hypothetical protein